MTWIAESFYQAFRLLVVLMIITAVTSFLVFAWHFANDLLDEFLLRRKQRKWEKEMWRGDFYKWGEDDNDE